MVLKLGLANVWTDSVCCQRRFGPCECLFLGWMVMIRVMEGLWRPILGIDNDQNPLLSPTCADKL